MENNNNIFPRSKGKITDDETLVEKPKIEKRGRKSKKEKGEEKFKKAIEAGARVTEKSLSKIGWDIAHDKIEITTGKRLDYQIYWALQCVADLIAQEKWVGQILNSTMNVRLAKFHEEPHRYFVVVEYQIFIKFLGRKDISTKKATEIFMKIPDIVLTGENISIPYCLAKGGWLPLKKLKGHICEVAVASAGEYAEHCSNRKMRGRGAGREEPVFILFFYSDYGKTFVQNAMRREGAQLQDHRLFRLQPEAQELFQAVRWKNDLIALNIEQISKICGLVWPVKNLRDRVMRIRKILDILVDKGFIGKVTEHGKKTETKAWVFWTKKRKAIIPNISSSKLLPEGNSN